MYCTGREAGLYAEPVARGNQVWERETRWTSQAAPAVYGIVLYCIVLYCIVLYCIVLYCIVQVEKQDSMLSQLQGEIRCERERLDEHRKQLQQCKKVITDLQKELERNQTEKQDSNDKVLW